MRQLLSISLLWIGRLLAVGSLLTACEQGGTPMAPQQSLVLHGADSLRPLPGRVRLVPFRVPAVDDPEFVDTVVEAYELWRVERKELGIVLPQDL